MDVTLVAATYHITSPQKLFKEKKVYGARVKRNGFCGKEKLAWSPRVPGTDYLTVRKRLSMSAHSFSSLEWIKHD
jgi:hypothetical protein